MPTPPDPLDGPGQRAALDQALQARADALADPDLDAVLARARAADGPRARRAGPAHPRSAARPSIRLIALATGAAAVAAALLVAVGSGPAREGDELLVAEAVASLAMSALGQDGDRSYGLGLGELDANRPGLGRGNDQLYETWNLLELSTD